MVARPAGAVAAQLAWQGATVDIVPGSLARDAALARAARLVVLEPFAAQVGFLLQHVGPYVSAGALGLSDARQLTKWWRGGVPKSSAMADRVHLLFQVAYAITSVYNGDTAARFLRSANPMLDYEAPLSLISGDPAEATKRVLAAVRALLD